MYKTQPIFEMTNLLMIELKVIDSMKKIDSLKTIDSVMTDSKMIDSIERLIAAEKLLIGLICTHVDVTEIVRTLIEK